MFLYTKTGKQGNLSIPHRLLTVHDDVQSDATKGVLALGHQGRLPRNLLPMIFAAPCGQACGLVTCPQWMHSPVRAAARVLSSSLRTMGSMAGHAAAFFGRLDFFR